MIEREVGRTEILLQQQVRKAQNRAVGIGKILASVESGNHRAACYAYFVARRGTCEASGFERAVVAQRDRDCLVEGDAPRRRRGVARARRRGQQHDQDQRYREPRHRSSPQDPARADPPGSVDAASRPTPSLRRMSSIRHQRVSAD